MSRCGEIQSTRTKHENWQGHTLRSSSCRASTARASFSLGSPRLAMAELISGALMALKRALHTWRFGLVGLRAGTAHSRTSKQMFSPSRSQSSHSTMWLQPFAQSCKCFFTCACRFSTKSHHYIVIGPPKTEVYRFIYQAKIPEANSQCHGNASLCIRVYACWHDVLRTLQSNSALRVLVTYR